MKIALVSTGLGRVLRGFESFTESLFRALRMYAPEIDVTLFKGGGSPGKRQVVVPNLHRYDPPARWFGYDRGNLLEKRSFAANIYPLLRLGRFDVVHYNELAMGSTLFHLRRLFGGHHKLLYCAGSTWSPAHYHHRCDFAQLITGPMYDEARQFGIEEDRLFLIPYGLNVDQFSPESRFARTTSRQELEIPDEATVVLSVATIDRETKRIDYLLKEASAVDKSLYLLVAGQRTEDTPFLEDEAERQMPGRWRFVNWPQERVHLLYGAADIFVLTSMREAFGRVTIEALLTGLPVVTHNGPIFEWVTQGTSAHTIDMGVEGRLAETLQRILKGQANGGSRTAVTSRFAWERLVPEYITMYEKVSQC